MIRDNDPIGPAISSKRFGRGYELETETPFTTPQEITEAAEAFAKELNNHDPHATRMKREIMQALHAATAAQTMRFVMVLLVELQDPHTAELNHDRADTVLRNVRNTLETL